MERRLTMMEGVTGPLLLLLLLLLLPKQEKRARSAEEKDILMSSWEEERKGREGGFVDVYCAAAISRRRSSPRSGAINEVPVKLKLLFYTSRKARREW